jgi:hypothetical protein
MGKEKKYSYRGDAWAYQQATKSWMTGTQENNRIAAAIMVCSFIVFLCFTQDIMAGAVKN